MTNTYPDWTSGTEVTANLLNAGIEMVKYKTANTDRASTVTPTDDPDLTITLEANAVYFVEFHIWYASTANSSGIRTAWTVPSGTTGNRAGLGLVTTVSSTTPSGDMRSGVHAYATEVTYGDRQSASNLIYAFEQSIVTTTTSGTCALKWAQDTTHADAVRMGAGSSMKVKRIA